MRKLIVGVCVIAVLVVGSAAISAAREQHHDRNLYKCIAEGFATAEALKQPAPSYLVRRTACEVSVN